MIDVLIIGAGPAGLSAAIYVQRAGKHAVCLEALTVGGQIVNTPEIANYPGIKSTSGFAFSMGLYEQATELGAEIEYEKAVSVEKIESSEEADKESFKVTAESGKTYEAKTVIIATGAKNRRLGLEKEDSLTGRGVSFCATCDGAFFKGKDVAVNGGGNIGSLWPDVEELMEETVANNPRSSILILPNTCYFSRDEIGNTILRKSCLKYNSHKNIILYARENS